MKYLKFILLLIIFTGCEKVWTVEQIIENSTGHDIMIKTYDQQGRELEAVTIAPNKSYTQTSIKEPRNTDDFFLLKYWADSVNIIFDNEKLIIQTSSYSLINCPYTIDRNIMCLNEYEKEDMGTHSIRYTYTITEADYERAVPFEAK